MNQANKVVAEASPKQGIGGTQPETPPQFAAESGWCGPNCPRMNRSIFVLSLGAGKSLSIVWDSLTTPGH